MRGSCRSLSQSIIVRLLPFIVSQSQQPSCITKNQAPATGLADTCTWVDEIPIARPQPRANVRLRRVNSASHGAARPGAKTLGHISTEQLSLGALIVRNPPTPTAPRTLPFRNARGTLLSRALPSKRKGAVVHKTQVNRACCVDDS